MADAYAIQSDAITEKGWFTLDRPTQARPKPGARILVFQRKADDVLFVGQSRIRAWEPEDPENPADARYLLDRVEPLKEARSLIVLGGSLEKTRRFLEPEWHFRSWLVALSSSDYMTIVRNRIDVPRSVFRLLFHALPLRIQSAFVQDYAELFPRHRDGSRQFRYLELAEALIDFLAQRLYSPLGMLERFSASYPDDIEGFPRLEELWILPGDEEHSVTGRAIPFGRDVRDMLRFRAENKLLRRENDRFPFLEECRAQLSAVSLDERRRWWTTDPIF